MISDRDGASTSGDSFQPTEQPNSVGWKLGEQRISRIQQRLVQVCKVDMSDAEMDERLSRLTVLLSGDLECWRLLALMMGTSRGCSHSLRSLRVQLGKGGSLGPEMGGAPRAAVHRQIAEDGGGSARPARRRAGRAAGTRRGIGLPPAVLPCVHAASAGGGLSGDDAASARLLRFMRGCRGCDGANTSGDSDKQPNSVGSKLGEQRISRIKQRVQGVCKVSDAEMHERMSQLAVLLSGDLKCWLENAPPMVIACLMCHMDDVARRIVALKTIFPQNDITVLTNTYPMLLLDADMHEVAVGGSLESVPFRTPFLEEIGRSKWARVRAHAVSAGGCIESATELTPFLEEIRRCKWAQENPWGLRWTGLQHILPQRTEEEQKIEAAVRALPAGAWVALPAPPAVAPLEMSSAAYTLLQLEEDSVVVVGRIKGAKGGHAKVDGAEALPGSTLVRGNLHRVLTSLYLPWRAASATSYEEVLPLERFTRCTFYAASVLMAGVPVCEGPQNVSSGQVIPREVHDDLFDAAIARAVACKTAEIAAR
ncbi:hypothetical protein FOA52_003207 [Chlamydomonas sp. UWO 241]|nr:hypothetical protein FOA52_003207 [Chlamydomonas sp. UWO 241]